MKWLLTVNPFEFDIDKAFKVGEYVEIPQLERYQKNDTIYILVQDINNNAVLRYICSVCELNIEIEESKFFNPFHKKTNQVQLIEFLVKLKFEGKNINEDLNYQNLIKLGLNKLPIIPLKNIGENKILFDKIDELFQTSDEDQIEKELKSFVKDSNDSIYKRNKTEFLKLFPLDDFDNWNKTDLLDNLNLCVNELNDIYYQHKFNDVYYFDENRSVYITNNLVINNIDLFAESLKNQIGLLINQNEDENTLKDYPVLRLTLMSYYFDITLLFGDLQKKVSQYFKFEERDIYKFNRILTEHLRNSFSNLQDIDGFTLTTLLANVFKSKNNINLNLNLETKYSNLVTNKNVIDRILKLLKTKNFVIVKNLKYGDGYPLVENLAKRICGENIYSIQEYNQVVSKSKNKAWLNYCLVSDMQEDSDLNYTLDYLKIHNNKNIFVLLYDFSDRDIYSLKQDYSLITTLFYEVKITPDFNDEVIEKVLKDGNNLVHINQLFALLKTINKLMVEENNKAELFSPLMFINSKFNIKVDYTYLFENKLPILLKHNRLTEETITKINAEIKEYIHTFEI